MALMHVPGPTPLPPFPGCPSLEELHLRHLALAEELADYAVGCLPALLASVVAQPLRSTDFRGLLDIPRTNVTAPVWRPFSLSDHRVGSQTGLLALLRFLRSPVEARPAPPPTSVVRRERVVPDGQAAVRAGGAAAPGRGTRGREAAGWGPARA